MTFETFIPARAMNVLELTGDAPEDFETSQEKFLEIQPECSYTVATDLTNIRNTFDAILVQSPLIGTLNHSKLVALIKKVAKHLKNDGTLIFTLDNIGHAENIQAILDGKPPKFKVTITQAELQDAIEDAGLNVLRSLNAGRGVQVRRQIAELTKTDMAVFVYIFTAYKSEPPKKTLIQTLIGESTVCAPSRVHMPNAFFMTEPNVFIVSSPVLSPRVCDLLRTVFMRAESSFISKGFVIKSSAPSSSPRTLSKTSPFAVSIIIGTLDISRISRQTCHPSFFVIIISRSMRSGA